MRDYNQIPFRSPGQKSTDSSYSPNPSQQQQHQHPEQYPHSPNTEKGTTISTAASTYAASHSSSSEVAAVGPRTTGPSTTGPSSPFRIASPTTTFTMRPSNNDNNNSNQRNIYSSPKSTTHSAVSQPPASSASSAAQQQQSQLLSPNDALSLRREGPEAVVAKLRSQLEAATAEAQSSRSAVSKSEAIILELRSTVRQLKRQVDAVQQQQQQSTSTTNRGFRDGDAVSITSARDAEIGELRVQLDQAHAQILTADMVRKELEDTLEAEQYTWELRVQDQERTIAELQAAVSALQKQRANQQQQPQPQPQPQQHDQSLEQALEQVEHWKALAEANGPPGSMELHERIVALEQERSELQGCLDEALKELEAVDAELQNDNAAVLREENERLREQLGKSKSVGGSGGGSSDALEPLQHLYRWILERDGSDDIIKVRQKSSIPDLVTAIQSHLEQGGDLPNKVKDLESQLSVYRGDLKAREDSSTELRASLKEAVALLKPLQDAVAKADKEKARLQEQFEKAKSDSETSHAEIKRYKELLNLKDDEIDSLKQEIESLELQLSKAKLEAANNVVSQHNRSIGSPGEGSYSSPRGRAKRQSEEVLKKMLNEAQSRFTTLNQQAQQVEAQNNELHGRLRAAAEESTTTSSPGKMELDRMQKRIVEYEARIHELENDASVRQGELSKKDVELRNLQSELDEARLALHQNDSTDHEAVEEAELRVKKLEEELEAKNKDLSAKMDAHRALNKSLKDALSLIKPLQFHLEEAEQEKRQLEEELEILRRQTHRNGNGTANGTRSVPTDGVADGNSDRNAAAMKHLEKTIHELETENAQLQDALEDMSQSINASHISASYNTSPHPKQQTGKTEARLREELVELKSRYEVTQARLEDSFVENHTLIEVLKKREKEEKDMVQELTILQEKLAASEAEVDSAKYIATSALVKIEQLKNGDSSKKSLDELYREKQHQIEQEMSTLI